MQYINRDKISEDSGGEENEWASSWWGSPSQKSKHGFQHKEG